MRVRAIALPGINGFQGLQSVYRPGATVDDHVGRVNPRVHNLLPLLPYNLDLLRHSVTQLDLWS